MTFSFELPPKSQWPKNGQCVIYCVCRLHYNGVRYPDKKFAAQYTGTTSKIRVDCKAWIPFKNVKLKRGQQYMRVDPKHPGSEDINLNLDRIQHNANVIKRRVEQDYGICTPERFIKAWRIEFSENAVLEMWEEYKKMREGEIIPTKLRSVENKIKLLNVSSFYSFDKNFPQTFIEKAGVNNSTARTYLATIRAFLRFGVKHNWHKNQDFEAWELPEMNNRKLFLSYNEVKLLYEADLEGIEDRCRDFFLFCFYTGLRKNEARNIRLGEDQNIGTVFIYKVLKQKKEREIMFSPPDPAMNLYLKYQGDFGLSDSQIFTYLKKAGLKAGLDPDKASKLTPHVARHTFITLASGSGVKRSEIIGHTGQTEQVVGDYDHSKERSTIASKVIKKLGF